MPRALVTGANGHIGANLVRELLSRGWEVVPFVRPGADLRGLRGLDLKPAVGDVMDRPTVDAAMSDYDAVFHTATAYLTWAKDFAEILAPAKVGTDNVLRAAASAGVKRVVYTSSAVAIGPSDSPSPRTERDWNADFRSPYVRAKVESERIAHRLAAELGVSMSVVCPAWVQGPLDFRLTPSTSLLRDIACGKAPIFKGGLDVVDVRDVARGHVLAAEKGHPGERYFLGGQAMTIAEFADLMRELTGVKNSAAPLPRAVFKAVGVLMEGASLITGRPPMLTRAIAHDYVGRYYWVSHDRSRDELGYEGRPAREVTVDALRWLSHLGELPADLAARYPADETWPAI